MSLETAAVVAKDNTVISWHLPHDRTSVRIPDSEALWDVVWTNRPVLGGVAHTHPGTGYPGPSTEDLTTFAAMEKGLGARVKWWILSASHSILVEWRQDRSDYGIEFLHPKEEPPWMTDLRFLAYPEMFGRRG